jgi:ornithine cyclodeaminase/mu-crystallin family protein
MAREDSVPFATCAGPVAGTVAMLAAAAPGAFVVPMSPQVSMVAVLDGGLLTDLRTAAAGAIAADLLARKGARTVAVIGTGGQARFQLQALLEVRRLEHVTVWVADGKLLIFTNATFRCLAYLSRSPRRPVRLSRVRTSSSPPPAAPSRWCSPNGLPAAHMSPRSAPTCRTSRSWIHEFSRRRTSMSQTASTRPGGADELHHAVEAGAFEVSRVYGELSALVSGRLAGRSKEDELTVSDLTGLGYQDAAMAGLTAQRADEQGVGQDISFGGSD